jgi:hypothetical protein
MTANEKIRMHNTDSDRAERRSLVPIFTTPSPGTQGCTGIVAPEPWFLPSQSSGRPNFSGSRMPCFPPLPYSWMPTRNTGSRIPRFGDGCHRLGLGSKAVGAWVHHGYQGTHVKCKVTHSSQHAGITDCGKHSFPKILARVAARSISFPPHCPVLQCI